jgi:hypothetical protein
MHKKTANKKMSGRDILSTGPQRAAVVYPMHERFWYESSGYHHSILRLRFCSDGPLEFFVCVAYRPIVNRVY